MCPAGGGAGVFGKRLRNSSQHHSRSCRCRCYSAVCGESRWRECHRNDSLQWLRHSYYRRASGRVHISGPSHEYWPATRRSDCSNTGGANYYPQRRQKVNLSPACAMPDFSWFNLFSAICYKRGTLRQNHL